jgi:hypothetical protein
MMTDLDHQPAELKPNATKKPEVPAHLMNWQVVISK